MGIATIWPILYMFLFFISIFGMMLLLPSGNGQAAQPESAAIPIGFIGIFVVHIFTMFVIIGLMAFYIVQVFRTDRLDQSMKIMWTVLICMLGMFAMPVFWYLYIWREPALATGTPAQLPSAIYSASNTSDESRREVEYNPQKPPDWR